MWQVQMVAAALVKEQVQVQRQAMQAEEVEHVPSFHHDGEDDGGGEGEEA